MLARAVALASVVGDDVTPLDRLPDPVRAASMEIRARFDALPRAARAAAVARESVTLFAVPAPAVARRVLPRGLVTALAPAPKPPIAEPAPAGSWIARALAVVDSLGLRALARALSPGSEAALPATAAELLRRLTPEETAELVAARRAAASPEDALRSRIVVSAALDARGGTVPLARRVGLGRVGWAASIEAGAVASMLASLAADERAFAAHAAEALWFGASEHAAAERARIDADLEARP